MKPTTNKNKTNFLISIFFTLGMITGVNTLILANVMTATASTHMEVTK